MADGVEIGKVWVKVAPDTDDFRRDAKRELDAIEHSLDAIKVQFEADVADLRREVERAIDEVEALADDVTVNVELDVDRASKEKVQKQLDDLQADVDVDLNDVSVRRTQLRLAILSRYRVVQLFPEVNKAATAKATATLAALSGLRAINNLGQDFADWLGNLDKSVPKIALASTAIINLIGFAGAATSNLLTFSDSLVKVGLAGLALPGILGGMAIGTGAMIAVLKDFNQVLPEVGSKLSHLQDQMSNDFWSIAQRPFRQFIDEIFPQFSEGMRVTSRSLGSFFGDLAEAGTGVFDGQLQSMFADLGESIRISGRYSEDFLGIIQKLGSVGAGNLPRLAEWFGEIAASFNDWLDGQGTAGLQQFVDTGISALQSLGSVIASTTSTLAGLARAAEAAGGSSLQILAETMKSVAQTVNSDSFQKNMTVAFEGAHDAMAAIADGAGPQFKSFIERLARTVGDVLPQAGEAAGVALGAIFDGLDRISAEKAVGQLFEDITSAFESLAPAVPGVVDGLAGIVDIIGELAKSIAQSIGPALEDLGPYVADLADVLGPTVDVLGNFVSLALQIATKVLTAIPAPVLIAAAAFVGVTLAAEKFSVALSNLIAKNAALGKSFAGLRADLAAVKAGLTAPGSQGVALTGSFYKGIDGIARRAGKAALAVGALALASSDFGQDLGLTNTVMLASAGLMVGGPWGAAIGGATGYVLDFAAGGKDASKAFKELNSVLREQSSTIGQLAGAYDTAQQQFDAYHDSVVATGFLDGVKKTFSPTAAGASLDTLFGGYDSSKLGEMRKDLEEATLDLRSFQDVVNELGTSTGALDGYTTSTAELDQVLQSAQPAMDALGISTRDLIEAFNDQNQFELINSIKDYMAESDKLPARTKEVAGAIADLSDEALGASVNADKLSSSLDRLLSPALNAEEATDQWRATLNALNTELKKGAGFKGFDEAAAANREASRDFVKDTMDMISARAEAGASSEEIAKIIERSRQAFIAEGQAAGLSIPVLKDRLRVLGLTPKLIKTVFEEQGLEVLGKKTRNQIENLKNIPRNVKTDILTQGLPKTLEEVKKLKKQYDLTPKQVKTLISISKLGKAKEEVQTTLDGLSRLDGQTAKPSTDLKDGVTRPLKSVKDKLAEMDAFNAKPTVSVNDQATSAINSIKTDLANLQDKTITVRIVRTQSTVNGGGGSAGASPRTVGPSTPRSSTGPDIQRSVTNVGGAQKVINYYAAATSFDEEEDLFDALDTGRAAEVW